MSLLKNQLFLPFRLEHNNVNLETQTITVRDSKNHAGRIIYMNELVYRTLKRRRESASSEWLFVGKNGQRRRSFDTMFRNTCRRAGIANLRVHDIRHQFGTDKKSAGADLQSLAILMGHKDMKTTERYGKPNEAHLRSIMGNTPPALDDDCPKTVQKRGVN